MLEEAKQMLASTPVTAFNAPTLHRIEEHLSDVRRGHVTAGAVQVFVAALRGQSLQEALPRADTCGCSIGAEMYAWLQSCRGVLQARLVILDLVPRNI